MHVCVRVCVVMSLTLLVLPTSSFRKSLQTHRHTRVRCTARFLAKYDAVLVLDVAEAVERTQNVARIHSPAVSLQGNRKAVALHAEGRRVHANSRRCDGHPRTRASNGKPGHGAVDGSDDRRLRTRNLPVTTAHTFKAQARKVHASTHRVQQAACKQRMCWG